MNSNEKCMIVEVCSVPEKSGKFEVLFSKEQSSFNVKENCAIINMCDPQMVNSIKSFINVSDNKMSPSHSIMSGIKMAPSMPQMHMAPSTTKMHMAPSMTKEEEKEEEIEEEEIEEE